MQRDTDVETLVVPQNMYGIRRPVCGNRRNEILFWCQGKHKYLILKLQHSPVPFLDILEAWQWLAGCTGPRQPNCLLQCFGSDQQRHKRFTYASWFEKAAGNYVNDRRHVPSRNMQDDRPTTEQWFRTPPLALFLQPIKYVDVNVFIPWAIWLQCRPVYNMITHESTKVYNASFFFLFVGLLVFCFLFFAFFWIRHAAHMHSSLMKTIPQI